MILLPLLLSTLTTAPAPADEVSPDVIREAIAYGRKERANVQPHYRLCDGGCFFGTAYAFATLTTPFLVIAHAAAVAPSFSEADVTPDMVVPEVRIEAFPTSGWSVKSLLIIPAHGSPIHPTRSEKAWPFEKLRPNYPYDRSLEPNGIVAFFPLSVIQSENEVQAFMEGGIHKAHLYRTKFKPRKMR